MPLPRAVQPRYWGFHLLALVFVAAAVWLGVWQYDAWSTRRADEARDVTRQEPIALDSAIGPDDAFPGDRVGQPVIVDGTWVPSGTVYVSGREHDGRAGYWVVTPLATGGPGSSALEIVRGWTPSLSDVPPAPTGTAEFVAWLQPPEGTGETDPDPGDDVLPQLRIADADPARRPGPLRRLRDRGGPGRPGRLARGFGGHQSGHRRADAGRPRPASGRGPLHRRTQPAVCDRVVVLRAFAVIDLVAVGAGRGLGGHN